MLDVKKVNEAIDHAFSSGVIVRELADISDEGVIFLVGYVLASLQAPYPTYDELEEIILNRRTQAILTRGGKFEE